MENLSIYMNNEQKTHKSTEFIEIIAFWLLTILISAYIHYQLNNKIIKNITEKYIQNKYFNIFFELFIFGIIAAIVKFSIDYLIKDIIKKIAEKEKISCLLKCEKEYILVINEKLYFDDCNIYGAIKDILLKDYTAKAEKFNFYMDTDTYLKIATELINRAKKVKVLNITPPYEWFLPTKMQDNVQSLTDYKKAVKKQSTNITRYTYLKHIDMVKKVMNYVASYYKERIILNNNNNNITIDIGELNSYRTWLTNLETWLKNPTNTNTNLTNDINVNIRKIDEIITNNNNNNNIININANTRYIIQLNKSVKINLNKSLNWKENTDKYVSCLILQNFSSLGKNYFLEPNNLNLQHPIINEEGIFTFVNSVIYLKVLNGNPTDNILLVRIEKNPTNPNDYEINQVKEIKTKKSLQEIIEKLTNESKGEVQNEKK